MIQRRGITACARLAPYRVEIWFYDRPHLKELVGGDRCFAGPAAGKALLVAAADVLCHGEAALRQGHSSD